MSHAPGPWRACRVGNCPCGQVWCDDYPVATVTRGKWGDTYPAIKQKEGTGSIEGQYEAVIEMIEYGEVFPEAAEANARLIAAAPELLEALEHCIHWLNSFGVAEALPVQQQARAAIAKATGSTA